MKYPESIAKPVQALIDVLEQYYPGKAKQLCERMEMSLYLEIIRAEIPVVESEK